MTIDDPRPDNGATDTDPTTSELLIKLQGIDTAADQLSTERERSPLRDDFIAKSGQLTQWEHVRVALGEQIASLTTSIEGAETKGAELTADRERLELQMKKVIAPREAEALMHEIATIEEQRDELDINELEALEEQSALEDQLAKHLTSADSVTAAVRLADDALSAALADIDRELAGLSEQRDAVRADIGADMLSSYDRVREALGVAVARLAAKQCLGCHLELSAAEIDTAKEEAAATGITECPQCGRMLVV